MYEARYFAYKFAFLVISVLIAYLLATKWRSLLFAQLYLLLRSLPNFCANCLNFPYFSEEN